MAGLAVQRAKLKQFDYLNPVLSQPTASVWCVCVREGGGGSVGRAKGKGEGGVEEVSNVVA